MSNNYKIVLLGSGELGKELVISLKRLGQHVVACDSYAGAPAMQVADEFEVFDMLDGDALDRVIEKHQPKLIVPEVEAIRTERFYDYEKRGFPVVPSAKAANFTMNRKLIRDLAAVELGLKTARYFYASSVEAFRDAVQKLGFPCVVKPLMSSSGKGQSVVRKEEDVISAFQYAMEGSRGDLKEVIVEEFIPFDYEITLLTVTQAQYPTQFCAPIGHRQERGDYRESWQPAPVAAAVEAKAREMAGQITEALGGAGIWGVEFFVKGNEVYFSELSPRPHDTGMVTLSGNQNLSEFDLHARAILQLPIPLIETSRMGVSVAVLADRASQAPPVFEGVIDMLTQPHSDIRIFGKPTTRPFRRMAVVLSTYPLNTPIDQAVADAVRLTQLIKLNYPD
ncbi:MAG TPA: formate-dependent phosphoribosylglycinamide formyltransferase [Luteibaculaceae bacterium]|nr:formate-dependent phosphoribosylglycinamide formyltransferase [Luteibaculaceae bacterium]